MPAAVTIPVLPAVSMDASLEFWQALGYEVRLRQKAPNAYAVIRSEDVELHLFGLRQLDPAANFTTCPVILDEVEDVHSRYAARLRGHLGRAPFRDLPRLSRMRPGQTRFTVTDVAGNSVIHVKRGPEDDEGGRVPRPPGPDAAAARIGARGAQTGPQDRRRGRGSRARHLLARHADDRSPDYRRALTARLELAELQEETSRASELRALLARLDRGG